MSTRNAILIVQLLMLLLPSGASFTLCLCARPAERCALSPCCATDRTPEPEPARRSCCQTASEDDPSGVVPEREPASQWQAKAASCCHLFSTPHAAPRCPVDSKPAVSRDVDLMLPDLSIADRTVLLVPRERHRPERTFPPGMACMVPLRI